VKLEPRRPRYRQVLADGETHATSFRATTGQPRQGGAVVAGYDVADVGELEAEGPGRDGAESFAGRSTARPSAFKLLHPPCESGRPRARAQRHQTRKRSTFVVKRVRKPCVSTVTRSSSYQAASFVWTPPQPAWAVLRGRRARVRQPSAPQSIRNTNPLLGARRPSCTRSSFSDEELRLLHAALHSVSRRLRPQGGPTFCGA